MKSSWFKIIPGGRHFSVTVVGHFKSCSLYYPGRNECKVGQNNLPLYFFLG